MERVRRTIERLRAVRLRTVAEGVIRGYADHDLLTFASAIAFQVLFALIPLALFGFGLLGGLGLQEQWTRQWGPEVRRVRCRPRPSRSWTDTVGGCWAGSSCSG